MKSFLLSFIFFLFSCISAFSQKHDNSSEPSFHSVDTRKCVSYYEKYFVGECNSKNILPYISSKLTNLKHENISIVLIDSIRSKSGTHFRFIQHHNKIPIYRSEIKVNCTNKGYITSVFDNTFYFTTPPSSLFPGINISNSFLSGKSNIEIIRNEFCYFPLNDQFIPAVRIELLQNQNYNYETIIDAGGNILYQRDLGNYYSFQTPIDSTVSATVFNPDPITTANVVYGTPYVDSSDIDITQLNLQRVNKNMKVTYSGDTFYLVNNFVQIKDFDAPASAPVFMVGSPLFSLTRTQNGFEDVNAFYHISEFQKHIQNLGFTNLVNYSIEVDPHAMNGNDNSQFIPSNKRLFFGEGGVDDAEDADVIVHEYGHAVSHSAAQGTNNGIERQALDEALGDYMASSYSRFLNNYKWENIFSWDGHNTFWPGRTSISSKTYPASLVSNIYSDAEIWSSTLMQVWSDIGRNLTDEILFESLYSYASNMTMTDAAILYIQADSNLYNGQHYTSICNRFLNRGLVSSCPVSIRELTGANSLLKINAAGFATGEDLQISIHNPVKGYIHIYDIQGRMIFSQTVSPLTATINAGTTLFNAGAYIISFQTETETYTLKAIRF